MNRDFARHQELPELKDILAAQLAADRAAAQRHNRHAANALDAAVLRLAALSARPATDQPARVKRT